MPLAWWEPIKRFLNINNNSCQPTRDMGDYDELYKKMVPFKGKSKFKQYVSSKPRKWGFKILVLARSDSIPHNFEVDLLHLLIVLYCINVRSKKCLVFHLIDMAVATCRLLDPKKKARRESEPVKGFPKSMRRTRRSRDKSGCPLGQYITLANNV